MPNFPLPDTAYELRVYTLPSGKQLKGILAKGMHGWDGVALQKCLLAAGESLPQFGADGWIGNETDRAIRTYQARNGLVVDGLAGPVTQVALAFESVPNVGPEGLAKGLFEYEGGNQLGNHTALYRDKSRDFGIVQDNLPDTERDRGFDNPKQIAYYFTELYKNYSRYRPYQSEQRSWELAAGWWNRPAWTDNLANSWKWPLRDAQGRVRPMTQTERGWIESYIDRVTSYVTW